MLHYIGVELYIIASVVWVHIWSIDVIKHRKVENHVNIYRLNNPTELRTLSKSIKRRCPVPWLERQLCEDPWLAFCHGWRQPNIIYYLKLPWGNVRALWISNSVTTHQGEHLKWDDSLIILVENRSCLKAVKIQKT